MFIFFLKGVSKGQPSLSMVYGARSVVSSRVFGESLCVCVCIYIYVCMYVCMQINVYSHLCI